VLVTPPGRGSPPEFLSFPAEKLKVFAPEEWRVPQGHTHLFVKVTKKERRKNGGQKTGQHVP